MYTVNSGVLTRVSLVVHILDQVNWMINEKAFIEYSIVFQIQLPEIFPPIEVK